MPNPVCLNHSDREALSFCFGCQKRFCFECLVEGPSHYYCRNTECQKKLKAELTSTEHSTCPSCRNKIQLGANFCHHCGQRISPITDQEQEDLVTVARYGTAIEAHMARTKLENCGIEAYVTDEQAVSMFLFRDLAYGGVKVKVKTSDATEAKKNLEVVSAGTVFYPPKWYAWVVLSISLFTFIFFLLISFFNHGLH
jgi:hypothetical protein